MKRTLGGLAAIFCLILLLLRPDLALTGAQKGLLLWANVVLPTLLPFMICSGAIVAFNGIPLLTKPFSPILSASASVRAGKFCIYHRPFVRLSHGCPDGQLLFGRRTHPPGRGPVSPRHLQPSQPHVYSGLCMRPGSTALFQSGRLSSLAFSCRSLSSHSPGLLSGWKMVSSGLGRTAGAAGIPSAAGSLFL